MTTGEKVFHYLLTAIVCTAYHFLSSLLLADAFGATVRGFLLA